MGSPTALNAGRSSVDRLSSRSTDSEASEGSRKVSSPIGRLRRGASFKERLSARASGSGRFSVGEAMQPPTQLEVEDEIKALQEQLRSISYTDLERGFHSGTHKQVGALQLSRLFDTLGLTVSQSVIKEIERVCDADGNGTLSKQELLEWLEGHEEGHEGHEGGALPGGEEELCVAAPLPGGRRPVPATAAPRNTHDRLLRATAPSLHHGCPLPPPRLPRVAASQRPGGTVAST